MTLPAATARLPRRTLLGAAAGLALAACGRAAPTPAGRGPTAVTLMLDWYPNADHAAIYAALSRGYFSARGLEVAVQAPSDTTLQIPLVAAGKADFAVSYEPDLLLARAQGVPVRAVYALVQEPLNCLIALQKEHITRPAELQGRKVGTSGTPGDTAILDTLVKDDGGDPAKVQNVNVGEDLVPALISGQVAAIVGGYWNWEAVEIAQEGYPDTVLHLQRWGIPIYDELIIVAREGISPGLARPFCAALAEGAAYAAAHPDAALAAILGANPSLSRALVARSLQLLAPAWRVGGAPYGYMSSKAWGAFAAWMLRSGWLQKPVDAAAAMTVAFLPSAQA
jgi:putative hydroxymethylpyrimidine transport system substrate-binding protein